MALTSKDPNRATRTSNRELATESPENLYCQLRQEVSSLEQKLADFCSKLVTQHDVLEEVRNEVHALREHQRLSSRQAVSDEHSRTWKKEFDQLREEFGFLQRAHQDAGNDRITQLQEFITTQCRQYDLLSRKVQDLDMSLKAQSESRTLFNALPRRVEDLAESLAEHVESLASLSSLSRRVEDLALDEAALKESQASHEALSRRVQDLAESLSQHVESQVSLTELSRRIEDVAAALAVQGEPQAIEHDVSRQLEDLAAAVLEQRESQVVLNALSRRVEDIAIDLASSLEEQNERKASHEALSARIEELDSILSRSSESQASHNAVSSKDIAAALAEQSESLKRHTALSRRVEESIATFATKRESQEASDDFSSKVEGLSRSQEEFKQTCEDRLSRLEASADTEKNSTLLTEFSRNLESKMENLERQQRSGIGELQGIVEALSTVQHDQATRLETAGYLGWKDFSAKMDKLEQQQKDIQVAVQSLGSAVQDHSALQEVEGTLTSRMERLEQQIAPHIEEISRVAESQHLLEASGSLATTLDGVEERRVESESMEATEQAYHKEDDVTEKLLTLEKNFSQLHEELVAHRSGEEQKRIAKLLDGLEAGLAADRARIDSLEKRFDFDVYDSRKQEYQAVGAREPSRSRSSSVAKRSSTGSFKSTFEDEELLVASARSVAGSDFQNWVQTVRSETGTENQESTNQEELQQNIEATAGNDCRKEVSDLESEMTSPRHDDDRSRCQDAPLALGNVSVLHQECTWSSQTSAHADSRALVEAAREQCKVSRQLLAIMEKNKTAPRYSSEQRVAFGSCLELGAKPCGGLDDLLIEAATDHACISRELLERLEPNGMQQRREQRIDEYVSLRQDLKSARLELLRQFNQLRSHWQVHRRAGRRPSAHCREMEGLFNDFQTVRQDIRSKLDGLCECFEDGQEYGKGGPVYSEITVKMGSSAEDYTEDSIRAVMDRDSDKNSATRIRGVLDEAVPITGKNCSEANTDAAKMYPSLKIAVKEELQRIMGNSDVTQAMEILKDTVEEVGVLKDSLNNYLPDLEFKQSAIPVVLTANLEQLRIEQATIEKVFDCRLRAVESILEDFRRSRRVSEDEQEGATIQAAPLRLSYDGKVKITYGTDGDREEGASSLT